MNGSECFSPASFTFHLDHHFHVRTCLHEATVNLLGGINEHT